MLKPVILLPGLTLVMIIFFSSIPALCAAYEDKIIVHNIIILGDRRTKKKTILKELTFEKGDAIISKELENSRQQLMNTNLFSEVIIEEVGIELLGSIDVKITVKEKWSYLPLPIFSRSSDADTKAGFSYEDFNLWGQGHYLKLKWIKSWADDFDEYVGDDYSLQISTYEITSRKIIISSRIEKKATLEKTYADGKEISSYNLHSDLYNLELTRKLDHHYYGISHSGSNDSYHYRSGLFQDYEDRHSRAMGIHGGYNTVDNLGFYTYRGFHLLLSASKRDRRIGSDGNSTTYNMDYTHFIHQGTRKNLAYRINVAFTTGDDHNEGSLSVGGSTSLRGYEKGEFKGDRKLQLNTEYRFPLSQNYWGGVLYIDGGYAWPKGDALCAKDLRWGAGFGLRLLIRQLVKGVGRFDFAYNFDRHETKGYMGVRHTF